MTQPPSRSPDIESRRTTVALAGTAVIILPLAIWLWSLHQRNLSDQHLLDGRRADIAAYATRYEKQSLAGQLLKERQRQNALTKDWTACLERLGVGNEPESTGTGGSNDSDHIDFKVALFDSKRRLQEKAAAAGTVFPADLGIRDVRVPDHDASTGLIQLGAIETLINLAIEHGVSTITEILPLPVEQRPSSAGLIVAHHPITMSFECSLATFHGMLGALNLAAPAFSISHLHIERIALDQPDRFRVQWVCDALAAVPIEDEEEESEP